MKISMVSERGELAAELAQLCAALTRGGHCVTVYVRRDDPDVAERVIGPAGVEVCHVSAGPARRLPEAELPGHMGSFARFLDAEWAAERPDVVNAHSWTTGIAAQLIAKRLDLPAVQTFHTLASFDEPQSTELQVRRHLEKVAAKSATAVFVTSSDAAVEVSRMGRTRTTISVVPYGVELDAFAPQDAKRSGGSRRRIVSMGKLMQRSGFDVVIRALPRIPAADFIVAERPSGSDHRAADLETCRLRELAEHLKVGDRVSILRSVAQQEFPGLLRSADVVACTPYFDSFSSVALEAMACGVPVVATAVGDLKDTIVHEVTGLLVDLFRRHEVGTAVNQLLRDEFLRRSLGAAGRDRVTARYTWDRIAADTARLYEGVASKGYAHASAAS